MNYIYNEELYHHGIKGQKWGLRRYQYEDMSLTPEGRRHYGVGEPDGSAAARSGGATSSSKHSSGSGSRQSSTNKPQKRGLTDEQKAKLKTAAKVGAVVAGTALVAYGAYKLNQSYDTQIAASKARIDQMNAMSQMLPPSMAMQTKPKVEAPKVEAPKIEAKPKMEPKQSKNDKSSLEEFNKTVEKLHSKNLDEGMKAGIELQRMTGVPENEMMKDLSDLDRYMGFDTSEPSKPDVSEKTAKAAKILVKKEVNKYKQAAADNVMQAVHDYSQQKISKEDLDKRIADSNKIKKVANSIDIDAFTEELLKKNASTLRNLK